MAVSAKLSKPPGQKISKVRKQQKQIKLCQSYSYLFHKIILHIATYVNRKVWYHQIWIPNNLFFIVSDLIYIPKSTCFLSANLKSSKKEKVAWALAEGIPNFFWKIPWCRLPKLLPIKNFRIKDCFKIRKSIDFWGKW